MKKIIKPNSSPYSQEDLIQLKKRHLSVEHLNAQIERFKKGVLPLTLDSPCTIGNGIKQFQKAEINRLSKYYEQESLRKKTVKFVPASGAATRMFHHLLVFREKSGELAKNDPDRKAAEYFLENIKNFSFYEEFTEKLKEYGYKIGDLLKKKEYGKLLDVLFSKKGMHYGNIPKALIKFHKDGKMALTPLEEHLAEAASYAKDAAGNSRVVFSVSPEFKEMIKKYYEGVAERYEQKLKVRFQTAFSVQRPSTDSVAVDMTNKPFKDSEGKILFRPSGHGALLDNLEDINADVVFIKNIDNVQPSRLKNDTYLYKKVLGGYLFEIQNKLYAFLEELENNTISEDMLDEALEFAENILSVRIPDAVQYDRLELVKHLYEKFHRPLRVCGVVKSKGEPGGAPFWVKEPDGSLSLQIVERAQVNTGDKEQFQLFNSSTHFNPVDLACGMRNHKGEQYNLHYYRNPEAGFITIKSHEGRQLKAYELPGLWNGSMANWNTVFVEVPLSTFSPAKTINDLLRKEHQ